MRYTEEELARLHKETEDELKKIPGVVGVGFGIKETSGDLTDEVAFRVYVLEKKNKEEIPPDEIIPSEIKGFKTDVLVLPTSTLRACDDLKQQRPLKGGITITDLKGSNWNLGTLGCFGRINGNSSKDNIVILTNNHVVAHGGDASLNDTIYQPDMKMENGTLVIEGKENYVVGSINNLGMENNYPYKYPEDPTSSNGINENYYIDCATVKLDTCYSSCCDTNFGVSFSDKNEINNLRYNDTDGNNAVKGIARMKRVDLIDDSVQPPKAKDYFVWKVGRATGRTKGKVKCVGATLEKLDGKSFRQERVICVVGVDYESCNIQKRFALQGDSGSVIVNREGNVLGLIYSMEREIDQAYACHIHPVLDKLKITLIADKSSTDPKNRALSTDSPSDFNLGKTRAVSLKLKLLSNERGSEFYHAFESCREEVVGLINRRRPVTVAWQRNQGPAFVSYFLSNTSDDSEERTSKEIKGISLHTLLTSMKEILKKEGSGKLRKTITQYENLVMTLVQDCTHLEDFVNRLTVEESV
ncbi:MAG: hypothetical protein J7604_06735 [Sporocytophaga sp.]|uniref:hypothetical protein n=1 Tax=Sporocytophaga sp. TaxID=2231183 RepID=UPI001B20EC01|nr:hypothetical protein [Sporocytophaga sp.]MBO9699890.1 hypothetical protein [Sporocytophaga sp.]